MTDSAANTPAASPDPDPEAAPLHTYRAHALAALSGAVVASLLMLPFAQPGERVFEAPLGALSGFLVVAAILQRHMRQRTLWYSFGFVAFMGLACAYGAHRAWVAHTLPTQ
jgi:hypothetical protein